MVRNNKGDMVSFYFCCSKQGGKNNARNSKLLPPPSPPSILLGDESGNQSRFQSTPQKNAKGRSGHTPHTFAPFKRPSHEPQIASSVPQNRSPLKSHNGRDNTESIDMEMSDEDYDTVPDFQSNFRAFFLSIFFLFPLPWPGLAIIIDFTHCHRSAICSTLSTDPSPTPNIPDATHSP